MVGPPPDANVMAVLESYQGARLEFSHEMARLAVPQDKDALGHDHTYEVEGAEKVRAALEASDTIATDIGTLINDLSPSVQQSAMIAMGRLCGLSGVLRGKLVERKQIEHVIATIQGAASSGVLKAAHYLLYSAVRTSDEAAQIAVDSGALQALAEQLEALDPIVKADATWCFAAIANHSAVLAVSVSDCTNALSLFSQCLKEPSLPLRRITLSCLSCIGKHDAVLAGVLQKEGLLEAAGALLKHRDPLIQRHVCRLLAVTTAQLENTTHLHANCIQDAYTCLTDAEDDVETGSFAAALLGQIARVSPPKASEMRELGASTAFIQHLECASAAPVPVALALAHLCTAQPDVVAELRRLGVVRKLQYLLQARPQPHVCAALCMALGAVGNADADSAAEIANCGALLDMAKTTLLGRRRPTAGGLAASRKAVARVLHHCTAYQPLMALLKALPMPTQTAKSSTAANGEEATAPEWSVLAALLKALAATLGQKGAYRSDFHKTGTLVRVQQAKYGSSELQKALGELNGAFPPQMVAATDPGYEARLLAQLE